MVGVISFKDEDCTCFNWTEAVSFDQSLQAFRYDDSECNSEEKSSTKDRHQMQVLLTHGHEQRQGTGHVGPEQHDQGEGQELSKAFHDGVGNLELPEMIDQIVQLVSHKHEKLIELKDD